jgi:hypothetical protein
MDNKKYDLLLNKLALKYNKPVYVIKKIVESQFEFINKKTKELDFNKVKDKEEFSKLKTNFNVKYLFTLSANYTALSKIQSKIKKDEM